jgi:very-short-patch-repair endonuclease
MIVTNDQRLVDEIWKKDNAKISNLEQLGYSIYTIWESEWKQDKNAVLSNIKKFLNDSIQTTSYGNDSN